MMDEKEKAEVVARLRRIEGQVRGIRTMVEQGRYCMDILAQTAAVAAAVRAVEDLVMRSHLATCVAEAMRSRDEQAQAQKIEEVMRAVARMRRHG